MAIGILGNRTKRDGMEEIFYIINRSENVSALQGR